MKPATLAYSENFVIEDQVLADARARAKDFPAVPIGPGGGAALRFLAAAIGARSVVEIGTGCGISGTWLLRGMSPAGVLTSVDVEAEHQRIARETFAAAGFPTQRTRLITGSALDVLSRLTEGHYDLMLCDGDKREYPEYLAMAGRLLRIGGIVAIDNALWHDKVADPSVRDAETIAVREVGKIVLEDENWLPVMLPVGDGLLCAIKTA
jgi:predicted O-methyltransferase YrrM